MTDRLKRWAAVAATGFLLVAATVAFAPGSQALPVTGCTTTKNVVVAVSFEHWGGPVVRGCGSSGGTGLAAMQDAGFKTTGTHHDGPAFVCRIASASFHGGAGYPTAAQDACVNTPPASKYWSYWHADPGQNSWSYSKLGAASYKPKPGSVDYWQFGATSTSGSTSSFDVTPDQVRAHNTSSGSNGGSGSGGGGHGSRSGSGAHGATAHPIHRGSGTGNNSGSGNGSGNGAGVAPGKPRGSATSHASGSVRSTSTTSEPAKRASSSAPRSAASTEADTASGSSSSQPQIINGSPAAHSTEANSSGGSALPLIIGLVAVLLIGGAAGITVVRRRAGAVE